MFSKLLLFAECIISLISHENIQEAKLKHFMYREIAQKKKEIYASITDTIKEEMGPGYNSKTAELWLIPQILI